MLKPLSGLLNLALPTALRENDTGPEAGGMPFADVFASLDQEAPDFAEPDEGEETSEMSVDEPKLSPSDGQQQTPEMADIDPVADDEALVEGRGETGSAPVLRQDPGRGDGRPRFQVDGGEASTGVSRDDAMEMLPEPEGKRARAGMSAEETERPSVPPEPAQSERMASKPLEEVPILPTSAISVPKSHVSTSPVGPEPEGEQIDAVQSSRSRRERPIAPSAPDMSLRPGARRDAPRGADEGLTKAETAKEIAQARSDTRREALPPNGAGPNSVGSRRPRLGERFEAEPTSRVEEVRVRASGLRRTEASRRSSIVDTVVQRPGQRGVYPAHPGAVPTAEAQLKPEPRGMPGSEPDRALSQSSKVVLPKHLSPLTRATKDRGLGPASGRLDSAPSPARLPRPAPDAPAKALPPALDVGPGETRERAATARTTRLGLSANVPPDGADTEMPKLEARQPETRPNGPETWGKPLRAASDRTENRSNADVLSPAVDLRGRSSGWAPIPHPDGGRARAVPVAPPLPSGAGAERSVNAAAKPPSGDVPSGVAQPRDAPLLGGAEKGADENRQQVPPKDSAIRALGELPVSRPPTAQRFDLRARPEMPETPRPETRGDEVISRQRMLAHETEADHLVTHGRMQRSRAPEVEAAKVPVGVQSERSAFSVPSRGTPLPEVSVQASDAGQSVQPPDRSSALERGVIPTRQGLASEGTRAPDVAVAHDARPVQTGQPADRPPASNAPENAPSVLFRGRGDATPKQNQEATEPGDTVEVFRSRTAVSRTEAHPVPQVMKGSAPDGVVPLPQEGGRELRMEGLASSETGQNGAVSERIVTRSAQGLPDRTASAEALIAQGGRTSSLAPEIQAVPLSGRNENVVMPASPDGRPVEPREVVSSIETRHRGRDLRHGAGLVAAGQPAMGASSASAGLPSLAIGASVERPAISVISPVIDLEEPLSEELFAAPLPSGSAPGSASVPGHATSVVAREAVVPVLRQAAEAMTAAVDAQDQVIELKLRPEELGQLRFRIGQGETGLMLSVTADRPETLVLLRRNVDQLARHLSDLGYGSASFSFGEERPGSQSRSSRESAAQGPDPIGGQVAEAAVSDPVAPASDGLDMRL